jgi:hypothetical protein
VNSIRKIGRWFWLNKERMILVIMVCILCYRVYQIIYPPPKPQEKQYRPPVKEVAEDQRPPLPPPPPPMLIPGAYASLHRQNPFWYYSREASDKQREVTGKDLGITLLNVRRVGETWRAQLRTQSTTRWYNEGEEFEQFVLERVNPEEKTVVIYSEQYARRFTYEVGQ